MSHFTAVLKGSEILNSDLVIGTEFVLALAAPLHLGQGGRPQIFPVLLVDLVDLCIAQADEKYGSGSAGFGCLHAHAGPAVIESH